MENEKNSNDKTNSEWEIDNLPNRLTVFRIILIPIIIASLLISDFGYDWASNYTTFFGVFAAFIFVIASITDFFDGHIARKRNITTVFGSFLDPIADKLLVVSSLIVLQELNRIPVLLVILLIMRELYMTSLRLLAMEKKLNVPVSSLGKWKTATQMMGIPLIMANINIGNISIGIIGTVLIYFSAFLSIYSAIDYSLSLLKKIKMHLAKEKEKKVKLKTEKKNLKLKKSKNSKNDSKPEKPTEPQAEKESKES